MRFIYLIVMFAIFLNFLSCGQSPENTIKSQDREEPVKPYQYSYLIENEPDILYGEIIYLPIYSEIFYKDQKSTIQLSATLSIHNTDLNNPVTLKKVYYHDTKGHLIRKYIDTNKELMPLETLNIIIEDTDRTGGTGANFIVEWNTENEVSSPIVEALMVTTKMGQGISFTSTGKVVKKFGKSIPARH
ncbi:MAG: DUF3124 domain-containing protein [Calditrichaceae bacterium]